MGKQGESRENIEKRGKTGENVEKHRKTRDNVEKTGKCMGTQGNFYIYWGHIMESYMRY